MNNTNRWEYAGEGMFRLVADEPVMYDDKGDAYVVDTEKNFKYYINPQTRIFVRTYCNDCGYTWLQGMENHHPYCKHNTKPNVLDTYDIGELFRIWFERLPLYIADYKDNPLVLITTGAATTLGNMTNIPGSSKVLNEGVVPYNQRSTERFNSLGIHCEKHSCVSKEIALGFYQNAKERWDMPSKFAVVTGALTTNRYRRGDDHAYIVIGDNTKATCYHFQFNHKLSQEDWNTLNIMQKIIGFRLFQDMVISDWVMQMVTYGEIKNNIFGYEGFTVTEVE